MVQGTRRDREHKIRRRNGTAHPNLHDQSNIDRQSAREVQMEIVIGIAVFVGCVLLFFKWIDRSGGINGPGK
jgi:hypothetical protein